MKKEILDLYFSGNCSPQEKQMVEEWLNKNEKNTELFYELLEEWERSNIKVNFNTTVEYNKVFNRILDSEYDEKFIQQELEVNYKWRLSNFTYRAAAVVLMLLAVGLTFYYVNSNKDIVYTSEYGKTKTITLPDHSIVTLNSNSSIRFSNHWDANTPREVILDGEAFFSIVHTVSNQKFIVKTADNLDIQVLGTEFNVKNRRHKTTVVLNKGKIQLNIRNKDKDVQLTMKPGELVEVKGENNEIEKKQVNPANYDSWKYERLVFDNSTIEEIALTLEEIYGKKIIIENDSLKMRRFKGTVSRNNLEILLAGLSQAFSFEVIHSKDRIYFKPNK